MALKLPGIPRPVSADDDEPRAARQFGMRDRIRMADDAMAYLERIANVAEALQRDAEYQEDIRHSRALVTVNIDRVQSAGTPYPFAYTERVPQGTVWEVSRVTAHFPVDVERDSSVVWFSVWQDNVDTAGNLVGIGQVPIADTTGPYSTPSGLLVCDFTIPHIVKSGERLGFVATSLNVGPCYVTTWYKAITRPPQTYTDQTG